MNPTVAFISLGPTVMQYARWLSPLLLLVLLVGACAPSGSSSTTSSESGSGISNNEIVVSELKFPVGGMSTYELVSQYKPHWLRPRGQSSINNQDPIKVYVDQSGSAAGNVSYLRSLHVANIASIRHFRASEAQFRFGLDNTSGAILVRMKGGGG